jgi:uridine kinase
MAAKGQITRIIKRTGQVVPLDKAKIANAIYKAAASVGGRDRQLAQSLADKVVDMLNQYFPPEATPSVEEIQDIAEKVLIENGHARTAKAYILYRDQRARLRRKKKAGDSVREYIPYQVMWKVLLWNVEHGVDTIEGLNRRVRDGSFPQLVSSADRAYDEDISRAAAAICELEHQVRMVIVAGPSSSGKTTTTAKLSAKLQARGCHPVPMSLDNYFFNLEMHPQDEFGDYDFETPEALDLKTINEHLARLLKGETVHVPRYDFKTGSRQKKTDTLALGENQVLVVDSLHGLYEPLTRSVPHDQKFKLYIETISQLRDKRGQFARWADVRMMRRMIRDHLHRSYNPERTIGHWHYVRRSELKHIIPCIHEADFILNGALPYELPILKKYLFHHFPTFIERFEDDLRRQDALIRAQRIYELLAAIEEVTDDACVPGDSLLREFVGGSIYE